MNDNLTYIHARKWDNNKALYGKPYPYYYYYNHIGVKTQFKKTQSCNFPNYASKMNETVFFFFVIGESR